MLRLAQFSQGTVVSPTIPFINVLSSETVTGKHFLRNFLQEVQAAELLLPTSFELEYLQNFFAGYAALCGFRQ
jgi:hypothetical protein